MSIFRIYADFSIFLFSFPSLLAGIQEEWKEVLGLRDKGVTKIVGTPTMTFALTQDGQLYAFGDKEYLGLSGTADDEPCTSEPVLHPICSSLQFADIACASNNATIALTTDGDVYVWGSPASSVVGTEEDDDETVTQPTKLTSKNTTSHRMTQVSVGGAFALMLGKKREDVVA